MVNRKLPRTVPEILSLNQVLEILHKVDFEEAILVGGQAVLLYAQVYGLSDSIELGISGDIDLIAKANVAVALKEKIKSSQLTLASIDSHTINTAVLAVDLNDRQFLQVDFLSAIAGLSTAKIEQRTVELTLPQGIPCRIINPLDLLTSKLYNLATIPSKRDKQGIQQAKLALDIATRYLVDAIAADQQMSLKIVEAYFKNCCEKSYVVADVEFDLPAFARIESLEIQNRNFKEIRLPQMKKYYATLRQKHIKLLKRSAEIAQRKNSK